MSYLQKYVEKKPWWLDYVRTTDDYKKFNLLHFIRDFIFQHRLRYIIYFRCANATNSKMIKLYYKYKMYKLSRKYGIEIKANTQIGKGFVMTHAYNITISPFSKIGDNVTILKGATLGLSNNGKKIGAPKVGNCVYIGINSTIIGGVKIGDDVLIAPNTLVNIDVPSHSVVIGSPCKIISRENAAADYINYKV